MTDDQDDPKSADTPETAIRGAFVARWTQATETTGTGDGEAATVALGSVYVSRLTREARRGAGATVGSEETADTALRSVFAARSADAPVARPAPPRKAAPKKAAPKKAAKKAARKAAKRAAPPKRKRAAAPARPKRKPAPAARAKKKKAPAGRRRR